jgi:hypothetical protein
VIESFVMCALKHLPLTTYAFTISSSIWILVQQIRYATFPVFGHSCPDCPCSRLRAIKLRPLPPIPAPDGLIRCATQLLAKSVVTSPAATTSCSGTCAQSALPGYDVLISPNCLPTPSAPGSPPSGAVASSSGGAVQEIALLATGQLARSAPAHARARPRMTMRLSLLISHTCGALQPIRPSRISLRHCLITSQVIRTLATGSAHRARRAQAPRASAARRSSGAARRTPQGRSRTPQDRRSPSPPHAYPHAHPSMRACPSHPAATRPLRAASTRGSAGPAGWAAATAATAGRRGAEEGGAGG